MSEVTFLSGTTVHRVLAVTNEHKAPVRVSTVITACGRQLVGRYFTDQPGIQLPGVNKCEECERHAD